MTEAHRRGVIDPMTASLIRVPGNGDPFVPEACQRKLAIFDGRMRYDLQLAFKRMDQVKAEKGYQGPVVVCAVLFRADRRAMCPIAPPSSIWSSSATWRSGSRRSPAPGCWCRTGSRFRRRSGMGVMQATQFVSIPQTPRDAADARTNSATGACTARFALRIRT